MPNFEGYRSSSSEKNEPVKGITEILRDPEFIEWFKGSVVVDSEGHPKVMLHGSKAPERFTEFRTINDDADLIKKSSRIKIRSFVSKGAYFTDNQDYIQELVGENRHIYRVFLSIKNPLIVEGNVTNDQISLEHVKELQEQGYDGIKTTEGGETYVAFEPNQIRIIPEEV